MSRIKFIFEDLQIWRKAIDFAKQVIDEMENIKSDRKHYRLFEQLESASASIALNIAEGKGRYSKKEFIQFLYVARGSLYETITLLNIFNKKNWITDTSLEKLSVNADEIGRMLSSLINSVKNSITL